MSCGLISRGAPSEATLKYYWHHVKRTIVHSGSQCHSMLLLVTGQTRMHEPRVGRATGVRRNTRGRLL
jgi:hypothetical protein